ncbi:MAG: DUF971 domain-containing protein [Methylacidiphilales bacterium]|nr:DUF971 domain-containing protein [Candidatus Methylacidiphilales bacterium]MDW8349717.1 DUF971 domain-containing protein [Verrucomicrobiae bacterium]
MSAGVDVVAVAECAGGVAVAWSDGWESYFEGEFLRRHCPCAVCRGEPDVRGQGLLVSRREVGAEGFVLRGWRRVGNYALQLMWGDGHETGLYSFSYLRELAKRVEGAQRDEVGG